MLSVTLFAGSPVMTSSLDTTTAAGEDSVDMAATLGRALGSAVGQVGT